MYDIDIGWKAKEAIEEQFKNKVKHEEILYKLDMLTKAAECLNALGMDSKGLNVNEERAKLSKELMSLISKQFNTKSKSTE